MTNYEKLMSMTVDQLAEHIYKRCDDLCDEICKTHEECPFGDGVEQSDCYECIKRWLKSDKKSV